MTTIAPAFEKFLAYDGDCPMCKGTVALLLRWGLVRPEQTRSNHVLEGAELEAVRAAGIRNQLVVFDPASGQTRSGSDALLWIIGDNLGHPLWVRACNWPGMRQLLRFGYETISYNRRVISPPRTRVVCDCEPEVTLARRLALIVPLVILAFTCLGLFGLAVFYGGQLASTYQGAMYLKSSVAAGWIALVVAAIVLVRGEQRIDYIAHLAVTTFVGGLLLLPAALVIPWLPPSGALTVAAIAAAASFLVMAAMQHHRLAAIGLAGGWLAAWLVATAAGYGWFAYVCYRLAQA